MPILTLEEAIPEATDPAYLEQLNKEFLSGVEQEKAEYMARQMVARRGAEGMTKMIEGLGQLTHVIDSRTYFRWQDEDEHFWDDDANVRKLAKDNPEILAPKADKKIQIVV